MWFQIRSLFLLIRRVMDYNNGSMKDYSIVGVKGGKPCKSDFERCVGCKE